MAAKVYKRIQSQLKSDNIPEDVELIKKEDDTIILRINDASSLKKAPPLFLQLHIQLLEISLTLFVLFPCVCA